MYFLKQFNEENGRGMVFSHNALEALQRCYFPGNVRELENCVYRTATMSKGEVIDEMDLSCKQDTCLSSTLWHKRNPADRAVPTLSAPIPVPTGPMAAPPAVPAPAPEVAAPSVPAAAASSDDEDLSERERLVQAMERCGWVQAKAARLLGLTPRQIGYALKKHNIEIQQL